MTTASDKKIQTSPATKAAKPATKAAIPAVTSATQVSGFMKGLKPSVELATLLGGNSPLPRTEVTKKLWVYIKAHNLQNPSNKRNILCDANMKAVMGKD